MADQINKIQRVAINTAYLYLRMILVMLVTLYTSRVVLQALGFNDYGIYNVVASIVIFLNFLQTALRNATFRYTTFEIGRDDNKRLNQVFAMAVNTHFLMGILVVVLLELVGVWFLNSHLNIPPDRLSAANWVFQFSLITVFVSIIRTPYESLILAHERMDFYAIISIVEVFLKLGIVYLLNVFSIDKLILYAALLAIITVVLSFGYYTYCYRIFSNCRYHRYWDSNLINEFSQYSGWSILVNGACMARSQCITIFFNLYLGVVANAALGIANQVINALNMFVTNFTQAFNPQIVKSWAAHKHQYFMKILFLSSKISYYLLLIVCIPVIINIDFILDVWLGDYPEMTAAFIETIILYYLVESMQIPLINAVHATGNLKIHQTAISSIVMLFIPICYVMLKVGYSGIVVLCINALTNVVCAVTRIMIMKRLIDLDVKQYTKKVILPVIYVSVLSLLVTAFFIQINTQSWSCFFLSSIISIVTILLAGYYFGFDKQERHALMSFVSTSIFKKKKK